jgi:hypothetical protein
MVFASVTQHHAFMEHRWGNRHEVSQSVRVATHGGVAARGRITNVSMSGAYVEAPLPVTLLSYVRVQFNSAADGRPTMVEGQVVRKDAAGFGLEWRELTPAIVEACVSRSANDLQVKFPRLVFQRASALDALPRL